MKNSNFAKRHLLKRGIAALFAGGTFLALGMTSSAQAQYWWDGNDGTAGFGTASGTWAAPTAGTATAGWSTNMTGATVVDGNSVTTTTSDALNFGTATDGLGAGTITVSGTVNANSLTFGALSGATTLSGGTITLGGATPTITVNNLTNTIGSVLTGANGLIKNGTGALVLTGVSNYTGNTTINGGVLDLSTAGSRIYDGINAGNVVTVNNGGLLIVQTFASGAGFSMGSLPATSTNLVVDGGTIRITNETVARGRPITVGPNGATLEVNSSGYAMGFNAGQLNVYTANSTLTLSGTGSATMQKTIDGSGVAVVKSGTGTWSLTASNTNTGAMTVNGGTLNLGGGTAAGSLASTVLNMGGGTFSYTRTGSTTQAFTTTNITAGANTITAVAGNTLTLGSLAGRSVGGTVNFGNTGTITTSTINGSGGIIGGWATFGGANWAVSGAAGVNTITGAPTYVTTTAAGTTAANYTANNIDVDNSAGLLDGTITPNTLRFNSAGANTVTLAPGDNIVSSGGILVTSNVGANVSTITGGNLAGSAGGDLIIHQNNGTNATANALSIGSIIKDNGSATGLTKSGTGWLYLTGVNTYTGKTSINGGTLSIGNNNATAATLGVSAYAGDVFIAGGAKLIFDTSSSQVLSGIISGDGDLQKAGGGTLTLSGNNTYTGKTTIAATGQGGPSLSVSSFNSVFTNPALGTVHTASSSLGAPTTVANGTIALGAANTRAVTLIYTGAGETTDRVIAVTFNGGNSPTITANTTGGGLLKFTSAFTATGTGSAGQFFTLSGTGNGEIAGDLPVGLSGGSGGLRKSGIGNWTLSGTANAFTGTMTLNSTTTSAGKLSYASAGGANAINFLQTTGTATLAYTGAGMTMSGPITANALTTGTITLEASGTGAINYSNTGSLGSTASGIRKLVLTGTNTDANTLAGAWVDNTGAAATLTKSGPGTWVLSSNALSYTGNTTVSDGTLTFDAASVYNPATAAGAILVNGANSVVNMNGTYNSPDGNTTGAFVQINGGVLNFSGDSTLTAGATGSGFRIGESGTGTMNMLGGTLDYSPNATSNFVMGRQTGGSGTLNVSGGTLTVAGAGGFLIGNAATASGEVNIGGTGTLAISTTNFRIGSNATATAATVNLNTGGTLLLGTSPSTLGGTSTINFDGGTLRASANLNIPAVFTAANVKNGGANFDTNGNSITVAQNLLNFSGATTDTLTKSGAGTLTLTGANTYTGVTTVSAGKLVVNGSTTSDTTVLANATLGGSGTINGDVSGAGNVAPGSSIETLTINGTYNITGLQQFEVNAGAGPLALSDKLDGITTLTYGGTLQVINFNMGTFAAGDSWDLYDFSTPWDNVSMFANNAVFGVPGGGDGINLPMLAATDTWNFDYGTGVLSIQAIPEPSTLVLGGLALLGFAGVGLRRRRMANQG